VDIKKLVGPRATINIYIYIKFDEKYIEKAQNFMLIFKPLGKTFLKKLLARKFFTI
jgi:hypothetical protein